MSKSSYGHIRKRENGTYRVYWMEYGVRKNKTFHKKCEAKSFLEIKQLNYQMNNPMISHGQFYDETIVSTYSQLAERTVYEYKTCWKTLKPYIQDIRIVDTNWHVVQHVLDKINSPTRQRSCFRFWRRLLNFAIQDNLLPTNPCNRFITLKQIKHRTKYIYTREELSDVLDKVNGTQFAIPILLECICGLRQEEYCGLDRDNIVIQDDNWTLISINKALTYAGGKRVLKCPKTKTSTRVVILHPIYLEYLKNNINAIQQHKDLYDYVDPLRLTKHWKQYAVKNDIPYTPFGTMRSVYASLSAEAGCIDSIVSRSMGHSGATVKDQNYLSVSLNALKVNATILAMYLKPEAFKDDSSAYNKVEAQDIQLLLKYRNLNL